MDTFFRNCLCLIEIIFNFIGKTFLQIKTKHEFTIHTFTELYLNKYNYFILFSFTIESP